MIMSRRFISLLTVVSVLFVSQALAQQNTDSEVVQAIRYHAFEQGQVMELAATLTDVYGPRLTGSPNLLRSSEWIVEQFNAWGLRDARLVEWGPFGRGWSMERFSMHVVGENPFTVIANPKAWSASIDGPVEAEVILFNPATTEDLAGYRGRLAGKIVMMDSPRMPVLPFEPAAQRRDEANLLSLANYAGAPMQQAAGQGGAQFAAMRQAMELQQAKLRMAYDEGALMLLDRGAKGEFGTIFVASAAVPADPAAPGRTRAWSPEMEHVIPQAVVAVEHYNRIFRLLERGHPVRMEVDLRTTYYDDDLMDYNVVGEIPGTDPRLREEIVMIGAHLDSWHAGTGATDNASGSAVMMEVMRILQAVYAETDTAPRRTIRVGLWTGEEQGLLGSRAYVAQHFTPGSAGHERFSAYYNMDNGTGRIRGIYAQGNEAVAPIFREWLRPFHDLDAATVTLSNTGGTDHLAFDAVGLPGFQFIQDPIAYSTRTHHSNMDVFDHLIEDDLKQNAAIIAAFVYHTAQRDERLPRKAPPATQAGR
jgi:carboxypeptidase Q